MDRLLSPSRTTALAPHGDAHAALAALLDELDALHATMLASETALADWIEEVATEHRASAANLAHYLALRRADLRPLQTRLAAHGLSSLGRSEGCALGAVDQVRSLLRSLLAHAPLAQPKSDAAASRAALARNASALFGPPLPGRGTHIMVTLPEQAASDPGLVHDLVASGMDIARINCAHDRPEDWISMTANVRAAAHAAGRDVRVLMDLGGPKLRTGPFEPGPAVLKVKPDRDAFGKVIEPARLELRMTAPAGGSARAYAIVDATWLASLRVGSRIEVADTRGAQRSFKVVAREAHMATVTTDRTAYLAPGLKLRAAEGVATIEAVPAVEGSVRLRRGDLVRVVADGLGRAGSRGARRAAIVSCTLGEALQAVRKSERIWFDDGRIGGFVKRVDKHGVEVEITHARDAGELLRADKGINLPDTRLAIPALTDKDLRDLEVIAAHADCVGLSFAQSASDVRDLLDRLRSLGAPQLGVILKIETRRGFEQLPEMLFTAMEARAAGVMIARGDLAVECGYERLAEVQEEILWACEAAHVPVIWATQVLETLAKTGRPTRAEITDAAMGERAECVMLNKGPHILDAMRTLDDILRRMQTHQRKKAPLLRALRSWERGD